MSKVQKKLFLFIMALALIGLGCPLEKAGASTLVPQQWLPGDTIFAGGAFTLPMHVFGPGYNATVPRVNAMKNQKLKVTMKEIEHQSLPAPYPATRVWAYEISNPVNGNILGPAHWPGVTIEATRYTATRAKYNNSLPSFGAPFTLNGAPATGLVQGLVSVDTSIHWANPLGDTGAMNCSAIDCTLPANAANACCQAFQGPIPVVAHLHGAEAFSGVDGGPEQWFTPNGLKGPGYFSYGTPLANESIYIYPNKQEPGVLWFHDHALGATRTNVYGGLAAFYFVRDPATAPANLPTGAYEVEIAIQDRQFDTNGQLFFPDGSPNGPNPAAPLGVCGDLTANDPCFNGPPPNPDIHPYWNPEFFGDVAVVNGNAWPVFNVEPRRYLFYILNGSNARFYRLTFGDLAGGESRPPIWMVGMDDGYANPVSVRFRTMTTAGEVWTPDGTVVGSQVFIGPGERNYVIVDFTNYAGKTVTVVNNSPAPFPGGPLIPGQPGQVGMAKIMRFNVSIALQAADTSCNPAIAGQCTRVNPPIRLTNAKGALAPNVTVNKTRQLILKEHQGPGGPIEVLVNNTHWDGLTSPGIATTFPADGVSELPQVGSTELWEIINLTMDAHPIHTHLAQFQVLNRQNYDPAYSTAWAAAFPACPGVSFPTVDNPCPGYGPPADYTIPNADGAIGGNPAVNAYLLGPAIKPQPEEGLAWKDTVVAMPGMVTRFVIRWSPTHIPKNQVIAGRNKYTFNPTAGPGYVWHCHIIDHEDNEMMRPYKVTP